MGFLKHNLLLHIPQGQLIFVLTFLVLKQEKPETWVVSGLSQSQL
jgi:hypothetical protein